MLDDLVDGTLLKTATDVRSWPHTPKAPLCEPVERKPKTNNPTWYAPWAGSMIEHPRSTARRSSWRAAANSRSPTRTHAQQHARTHTYKRARARTHTTYVRLKWRPLQRVALHVRRAAPVAADAPVRRSLAGRHSCRPRLRDITLSVRSQARRLRRQVRACVRACACER